MVATGFNDEGADKHQVKFISRVGLQLQMLIFLLTVITLMKSAIAVLIQYFHWCLTPIKSAIARVDIFIDCEHQSWQPM